jgi:protein disulfide-isomerase
MKIWTLFVAFLLATSPLFAADPAKPLPYDETADAKSELKAALSAARDQKKHVLVVFGANWCKDCRELDKALSGAARPLIAERFIVLKVDVGNFDKNLDIAAVYGNPIKPGIPAVVVVRPPNDPIYATRAGELADARQMGEEGIADFFRKVIADSKL